MVPNRQPDKERRARAADDAVSDDEWLARYEAEHGPEAAAIVAKTLGLDPLANTRKAVRRQTRVGRKPKHPRGIGLHRSGGPSLAERLRSEPPPPETPKMRNVYVAGECRARDCAEPTRALLPGADAVMLFPSKRLVHPACAPAAVRERIVDFERHADAADGEGGG